MLNIFMITEHSYRRVQINSKITTIISSIRTINHSLVCHRNVHIICIHLLPSVIHSLRRIVIKKRFLNENSQTIQFCLYRQSIKIYHYSCIIQSYKTKTQITSTKSLRNKID